MKFYDVALTIFFFFCKIIKIIFKFYYASNENVTLQTYKLNENLDVLFFNYYYIVFTILLLSYFRNYSI